MEIKLREELLTYQDFEVSIKGYNVVLSDSRTICHSTRDSFFVAFLKEDSKVEVYRIKELKGVILVGSIWQGNIWMYVVRQMKEKNEFKTICFILRYNPYLDRFREIDNTFLRSELEVLTEFLGEWYLDQGLIYIYSKNTYLDPASFLMEKIPFKNEQLVTETELV